MSPAAGGLQGVEDRLRTYVRCAHSEAKRTKRVVPSYHDHYHHPKLNALQGSLVLIHTNLSIAHLQALLQLKDWSVSEKLFWSTINKPRSNLSVFSLLTATSHIGSACSCAPAIQSGFPCNAEAAGRWPWSEGLVIDARVKGKPSKQNRPRFPSYNSYLSDRLVNMN